MNVQEFVLGEVVQKDIYQHLTKFQSTTDKHGRSRLLLSVADSGYNPDTAQLSMPLILWSNGLAYQLFIQLSKVVVTRCNTRFSENHLNGQEGVVQFVFEKSEW